VCARKPDKFDIRAKIAKEDIFGDKAQLMDIDGTQLKGERLSICPLIKTLCVRHLSSFV
jgi:hypothetical protein